MSFVLEENESSVIINENALLDDTIEAMLDKLSNNFTSEQVKCYLTYNDVMSRIINAMLQAQSDEIVEISQEMEEQARNGGFLDK